jgi:DNA polymerase-3 subunit epsilon
MMDFTAIDFETATDRQNSACSVAVVEVRDGKIAQSYSTLIRPPRLEFSPFNIGIHGITPEMVEHERGFAGIWPELHPFLENRIVLAHNAPFDMGVLAKCLKHYELDCPELLSYACTCQMARRFYPCMHHGLADMCELFGIGLDHHKADSDARACAELAIKYTEYGKDISPFFRRFDVVNMKTLPYN